jgi:transcriptional regulator with XRE-family HTH domain
VPGVSDHEIDRFYSIVGKNIKSARSEAGISQTVLAQRIGFNRSSIANLEAGRQRIALHLFFLISEAIGVSPAALLPDIGLLEVGDSTTIQKMNEHLAGATETSQDFVRETIARAIQNPHHGGN